MARIDIIDAMIEKYSTSYSNKIIVRKEFKDITDDTPIEILYHNYIEAIAHSKKADELKFNCKSDYFYWGYISDYESYTLVAKIYAKLIFDLLNIDYLPEFQTLQLKATRYDKIKEKAIKKAEGFNEFKPAGYKTKIELLNEVLDLNIHK